MISRTLILSKKNSIDQKCFLYTKEGCGKLHPTKVWILRLPFYFLIKQKPAKAIPAISNFVNLFYFWSFTFCIAHAAAGRGGGDDLIKSHFERKKNPIQTSCHCEKRVVASIPGNEYAYPEGIFFFNNFILHFRDFTQLS